jgi:hypothetical protein
MKRIFDTVDVCFKKMRYQQPKVYLRMLLINTFILIAVLVRIIYIILANYWILFGIRREEIFYDIYQGKNELKVIDKQHRFPIIFSSAYRPSLYSLLEKMHWYVIDVCDNFHLNCFLEGGTLLGSFRSKRIFPWDEDGDFIIHVDEIEKFKQLSKSGEFRQFAKEYSNKENNNRKDYYGFDIVLRYDTKDIFARCIDFKTKIYIDFYRFETVYEYKDTKSGEIITVKDSKKVANNKSVKKYVFKDFAYSYGACINCIKRSQDVWRLMKIPYDDVFPLVKCTLNTKATKCPRNTKAWLQYYFGDGYETVPYYQRSHIKVMVYIFALSILYVLWKLLRLLIKELRIVCCQRNKGDARELNMKRFVRGEIDKERVAV